MAIGWIRKFWKDRSYAFISTDADPEKVYHWRMPDGVDRDSLSYRRVVEFTPVENSAEGKNDIAANVRFI